MACVKPTEKVRHLAESFCAANSAWEAAFLYYKFGRYQDMFPEKPYFLLSHCAHILFSLWRVEEEGKGELFEEADRPTAFLAGLDFGKLRYTDYKRRLLHADSLEEHWRNETQWFRFWIQVLESLDPTGASLYQELSRWILAYATEGSVLRGKAHRRHCRALCHFMRSDTVGYAMRRTLAVLDELMRGIARCVARVDPKAYVPERIAVLIGLLGDIRRTVVHLAPVKGPYAPSNATRWKAPFRVANLFLGRTQGTLIVVPKREGGDIICHYSPLSGPGSRKRSWVRRASSLADTYEQELFATWAYETGQYREDPDRFPDVTACWQLQHDEVGRLQVLAGLIDALLDAFGRCPQWAALIEEVKSVSRNGSSAWRPAALPWTYIRRLDQVLDRLAHARQEAITVREYRPVEEGVPSSRPAREEPVFEPVAERTCAREDVPTVEDDFVPVAGETRIDPIVGPSDIANVAAQLERLMLCNLVASEPMPGVPDAAGESAESVPDERNPHEVQIQPRSEISPPPAQAPKPDEMAVAGTPDVPAAPRRRATRRVSGSSENADGTKRPRSPRRSRSKKPAGTPEAATPHEVAPQPSDPPRDDDVHAADVQPQAVKAARPKSRAPRTVKSASSVPASAEKGKRSRPTRRKRSAQTSNVADSKAQAPASHETPPEPSSALEKSDSQASIGQASPMVKRAGGRKRSGSRAATPRKPRAARVPPQKAQGAGKPGPREQQTDSDESAAPSKRTRKARAVPVSCGDP